MRQQEHSLSWPVGLLLAMPALAAILWLTAGGLNRSFGPMAEAPAPSPIEVGVHSRFLPGFPPSDGDFPAARLHERVNGAADALIADGCRRLLLWRLDAPRAELELLVFDQDVGAARVLAREAGPERSPGLGDEASISAQAVFFRRGRLYARLLAAPGAADGVEGLVAHGERVDRALMRAAVAAEVDVTRVEDSR